MYIDAGTASTAATLTFTTATANTGTWRVNIHSWITKMALEKYVKNIARIVNIN